ncbi:chromosomal replication initiator protein DnaA [Metamycoplasma buccale]|uniref:chromosomal replication initiator protein DnaA n=1 Tax=Metamycoplasma buccale TaxID=55602 RepID=UPI00398F132D
MKIDEELQINLKVNNLAFKDDLKNNLSDEYMYEQFLSTISIVHEENETIYLLVPEPIMHFIKNTYSDLIERTICNIYTKKVNVIYITDIAELNALKHTFKIDKKNIKKSNVKNDLTFEKYAAGKFNNLALKAAKTIYTNDQVIFSPLFIYSSSGLGKTHLLHAIGNELLKKGLNCYYVNPDYLTRKLVEQLKNKNQEEINKIVDELTSYDCLMFDDVQQYGNKESTLNVLFNIVNTLMTNKKQIIISADKKPDDLGGFEERFITRFNCGLTIEIQQPDIDDVINILKFKLNENNINPELWEDESLRFIARNFSNSIRSLEGAINRIKLFSAGDDYFTYDLQTMKMIFKNASQIKDNISPERIIEAVSKYYKIDKRKITSKTRKEDIVMARRISMWLIKDNFDYSLEEIGKMFGNQSHSTVIVSIRWIDNNIKTNSTLKLAIGKVKENLNKIL